MVPPVRPGGTPDGEAGGGAVERPQAAGGASPLPCLNSNNSTEGKSFLTSAAKRTAFILMLSVKAMVERYCINYCGFLTLTFADHVIDAKEAQRRLNSLISHVISSRYVAFIKVFERQKSGRIHYHILIVLRCDIRTGVDFAAFARGDYRSAPAALRAEWAFWRKTAKAYGFGRTELMPVKSSSEAIGKYVGKYISKHLDNRVAGDKGVRLVSGSKNAMVGTTKFAWHSPAAWLWRRKLEACAKRFGFDDVGMFKVKYGARWAYKLQQYIAGIDLLQEHGGTFTYPDKRTAEIDGHNLDDIDDIDFKGPVTVKQLCRITAPAFEREYDGETHDVESLTVEGLALDEWIELLDRKISSSEKFQEFVKNMPPPHYEPRASSSGWAQHSNKDYE